MADSLKINGFFNELIKLASVGILIFDGNFFASLIRRKSVVLIKGTRIAKCV